MDNENPNSRDESSRSGFNRQEKTMQENNDEDKRAKPAGCSRRDFMVSAATAVASVGAASLLNLQSAQAAMAENPVAIGNGPYPTEGMAAYSPTPAHEVRTSRFGSQRRRYQTLLLRGLPL
ncbi:MAG: twin-arginine translocation signal domain-containing protein [Desulfuromonadales bacterium]|nr:twin-arginine translocation signal domain-containing protein [Desulfuromonadales bacterium]